MFKLKIICFLSLLLGNTLTSISPISFNSGNPPFDISQYPQTDQCQDGKTQLTQIPKNKCLCTHYLFALDESGSMGAPFSKWEDLMEVMNNFTLTLAPIPNYFISVF